MCHEPRDHGDQRSSHSALGRRKNTFRHSVFMCQSQALQSSWIHVAESLYKESKAIAEWLEW
jgi:hypothetical protein